MICVFDVNNGTRDKGRKMSDNKRQDRKASQGGQEESSRSGKSSGR